MSDKYKLEDGRTLRVINGNILVEQVPLPDRYKGSSIIINRAKEDATAVGIVRAVSLMWSKKGTQYAIPGLEPGVKVAFLWFYAERHTNQQLKARLGENLILLKWEDISLVWPATHDYEISDIASMGV